MAPAHADPHAGAAPLGSDVVDPNAVDAQPWGAPTEDERAWLAAMEAGVAAPGPAAFDPVADALAVRRLLALPRAHLPAPALLRAWREVEGARLARDAGLKLATWGPPVMAELARARFGATAPLARVDSPEHAIALAATPGVIAVLDAAAQPWWARLLATPHLQVVARLPEFGTAGAVLAVGRAAPGPTGLDETFWVTDAPGSPAALAQALSALGLAADAVAQAGGLKLMALAGYLQAHDERLARAPGRLRGVIGAAPLPLVS